MSFDDLRPALQPTQQFNAQIFGRGGVSGLRVLRAHLERMDGDGSGLLERSELCQGLANFGVDVDDGPGGDVEKIMGFFDRDVVGRISIREFHRGLRVSPLGVLFSMVKGTKKNKQTDFEYAVRIYTLLRKLDPGLTHSFTSLLYNATKYRLLKKHKFFVRTNSSHCFVTCTHPYPSSSIRPKNKALPHTLCTRRVITCHKIRKNHKIPNPRERIYRR